MKKRLLLILTIFISFSATNSFAQKQGSQWYFGWLAGLNFNSGAPVPITNSILGTGEGSSSISNPDTGDVMFYTDGSYAYDRTNNIMPHGRNLGGSPTSTQSALIVPLGYGQSYTQFDLFTVDDQAGYYNDGYSGITSNIVDMSLNGGLGDVDTTQTFEIYPPVTTEKLAATVAFDGSGYWMGSHQWDTNGFVINKVSLDGITQIVTSYTGINHSGPDGGENSAAIGYMEFSPDGNKLAVAVYEPANTVQVFDFNNATGVVSSPIMTDTNFYASSPYGVSFSPDNARLYVTTNGTGPQGINLDSSYVYQYNMLAGSDSAIIASRTEVAANLNLYGAVQIAPDGKMYVAVENAYYLDVIENPNALGTACNYIAGSQYLGGYQYSILGLPNMVEQFLLPPNYCTLTYGGCPIGDAIAFFDTSVTGSVTYLWNFDDPASGTSDTSTQINAYHDFSSSGSYTVKLTFKGSNKTVVDSQVVVINVVTTPTITVSVTGDSLISSAASGNQWYFNDEPISDSTKQVLVIKGHATGWFSVKVTDGGCSATSDSVSNISTSINQLSVISEQLSIYPNPTSSSVFIKINSAVSNVGDWSLQIIDVLGRTLCAMPSLNYTNEIDLSNVPSGIYFITVVNKTDRAVFKVVKQN